MPNLASHPPINETECRKILHSPVLSSAPPIITNVPLDFSPIKTPPFSAYIVLPNKAHSKIFPLYSAEIKKTYALIK
jgi:hypothetical protein